MGSAELSLTENTVRCLFWGMLNEFITKAGFRGGQAWNTRRRTVCPGLLWITHETTSLNNTSKIKGWTGMPIDSALSHSQKNSSLAHGYYSGLVPENSMCGHDLSLVWLSYTCNTATREPKPFCLEIGTVDYTLCISPKEDWSYLAVLPPPHQ